MIYISNAADLFFDSQSTKEGWEVKYFFSTPWNLGGGGISLVALNSNLPSSSYLAVERISKKINNVRNKWIS